jgi:hypothetical protein
MEKSNMFETTNKSCDSEGILADHHPFKKKKHIAGRWSLGPKVPPRQNDPEAEANKI